VKSVGYSHRWAEDGRSASGWWIAVTKRAVGTEDGGGTTGCAGRDQGTEFEDEGEDKIDS